MRSLSHGFATAVLLLQVQHKTTPSATVVGHLHQMHLHMAKDMLAPETAAAVTHCWRLIHDLENHALIASIEVHVERCMIMASHAAAFGWVQGVFDLAKDANRETCWASRVIHVL